MAGEKPESRPPSMWFTMGQYMGHGLSWALSTMVFLFLGWWLDRKLGTGPVLMILGAFIGATAGFYSMYRHIIGAQQDRQSTNGPDVG